MGNLLEAVMLLAFASAWPFNIIRAYRARTAIGTSLLFMAVIEFAYVCGMLSKIVSDDMTYVFAFYVLDFALVAIAIALYFRNRAIDRSSGKDKAREGRGLHSRRRRRTNL